MNKPVDKDSLKLNQPKRTPGHPTKSHIVKTKVDGKEKIIRFGQQGASTAGKPKEGESERMTAKRASFKARHSANIAKGPSSAAYWANKVKWADGGSVRTNYADGDSVQATPQSSALGSIADFLKKSYSPERTQQMQGTMEFLGVPAIARTVERMSYGEPITNVGKANVPMLPDDTAEAAITIAPIVGPLGRVAKKVGKAGAKVVGEELNRAILDNSGALAKFVPEAAKPKYVIKPKGGNWLAGSIEQAVGPLKTGTFDEAGLIGLANRQGVDVAENVRIRQEPSIALNKWIDQKLVKYLKNELATPEDPVRDLAERGITHAHVEPTAYTLINELNRKKAGFPKEGMGVSPQAKAWENKSDTFINKLKASDLTPKIDDSNVVKENPWLLKVPPETSIYDLRSGSSRDLGFSHLIDELDNATNPESTLPANLRLTPAQLDKVTMSDAVKLVSKINDWRAAEAAKAELAGMSENLMAAPRLQDPTAQLSFVKEPGMTWVDIPATTDKKANKLCTTIGKQAGWCTQEGNTATRYGSGDNRLTTLLDAEGRPHAQAKISSIPQSGDIMEDIDDLLGSMSAAEQRKFNKFLGSDDFYGEQEEALEWLQTNMPKAYDRYIASVSGPPSIGEIKPVGNYFDSERALEYEKRDPQYRAKITDSVVKFLNSGEWSEVKDLDIYDIIDAKDPTAVRQFINFNHGGDFGMVDANSIQKDFMKNYNGERFIKAERFTDLINDYIPKTDGYAAGGSVSVYDSDKIDEIINGLDDPQGYAEGGEVRMGKGGIVKAALEEARDQILKLRALKNEGKHQLEDNKELPTRFYRGMAAMVKGGEDSPKDFDELTKQYLNSREPMSEIKSLVATERPSGALSDQINMRRANAWAASNPLTAASYATTPNSVMVPLQLKDKPSIILDAGGLRWDKYFPQTGRISKSGNYTLNSEFRDALRDPKVKSILLKNIMDSGAGSVDELSRLYGMDITKEDLLSHNLLIKDPSVVRYGISGEVPSLKEPKVKKAKGGSVSVYDPDQVDAIANQFM